jgi:hypothetical protein
MNSAHETREWTRKEGRSQDLQRVKAALYSFPISASEFFASFRVFRGQFFGCRRMKIDKYISVFKHRAPALANLDPRNTRMTRKKEGADNLKCRESCLLFVADVCF